MDYQVLKELLIGQQEWLTKNPSGLPRAGLEKLQEYLPLSHVIIISGIRRVGKSTLLSQLIHTLDEPVYYCNFEDERFLDFTVADFNQLYEVLLEISGERRIFCFDEIQNINGWERFVRRMHDTGFKFFITGSNASLLSKELGTRLTGRELPYRLYPLSFREYLLWQQVPLDKNSLYLTTERAAIKKQFALFLKNGGMPSYVQTHKAEVLQEV